MKITSSKTQNGYDLKVENMIVAQTVREGKNFKTSIPMCRQTISISTMKSTKRVVEQRLRTTGAWDEIIKSIEDHKVKFPSVERARKFCGFSHNAVREFLKELKEFYPHIRPNQFGNFMIWRHETMVARWSYGAEARKWLDRNRKTYEKFHEVDWDYFEKTGHVAYVK